ncbi:MAG TPA: hypothetical protein VK058_04235 [Paenalcaligenes sp.]|nr:hypothetical protein [Paenalcaligenes sp.]
MKTAADIKLERAVRLELLRMRSTLQREEFAQLSCALVESARPRNWAGRLVGTGLRPLMSLRWGRSLWGFHQRYELLISSAWLLATSLRGRSLRWPTVGLLGLRLIRFGLQRRQDRQRQTHLAPASAEHPELKS